MCIVFSSLGNVQFLLDLGLLQSSSDPSFTCVYISITDRYPLAVNSYEWQSAEMKALKWSQDLGKVTLVNVDLQPPEDISENNVTVRVMFSGVCGSDLLLMDKRMDAKDGVIPGHEVSGVVHQTGSRVHSLKPGDPVVVMPPSYCGVCRLCLRGQVRYCAAGGYVGFDVDGGWAEFIELAACQVFKLPESLRVREGLLCQPYSCVAAGWDNNGVLPDDAQILVMGAGIIGLLWSCLFHHHGFKDVTITELSTDRRSIAGKLELGYNICHPDSVKNRFSGCEADTEGFDIIVDATGSTRALSDAIQWLRKGGKLNMLGCWVQDADIACRHHSQRAQYPRHHLQSFQISFCCWSGGGYATAVQEL